MFKNKLKMEYVSDDIIIQILQTLRKNGIGVLEVKKTKTLDFDFILNDRKESEIIEKLLNKGKKLGLTKEEYNIIKYCKNVRTYINYIDKFNRVVYEVVYKDKIYKIFVHCK